MCCRYGSTCRAGKSDSMNDKPRPKGYSKVKGYITAMAKSTLGRLIPQEKEPTMGATVYVLHCPNCVRNYGANVQDLWHRRCPCCQGGTAGEPLRGDEFDWRR